MLSFIDGFEALTPAEAEAHSMGLTPTALRRRRPPTLLPKLLILGESLSCCSSTRRVSSRYKLFEQMNVCNLFGVAGRRKRYSRLGFF